MHRIKTKTSKDGVTLVLNNDGVVERKIFVHTDRYQHALEQVGPLGKKDASVWFDEMAMIFLLQKYGTTEAVIAAISADMDKLN